MREYSFDLATGNPKKLITVTLKNGTVIRTQNWAKAITIGAETWTPLRGLQLGDATERADGTIPSTTLTVAWEIGGTFDPADIAERLFEDATVLSEITNADNPTTRDFDFYGIIGKTTFTTTGLVIFELRNPFGFDKEILVPKATLMCRHAYGDRFCQRPLMRPDVARSTAYAVGIARRFRFDGAGTPEDYRNRYLEVTAITTGITAASAPAFSSTIAATTVDGGVTWTTRDALERAIRIGSVVDRHNVILDRHPITGDVDNYFNPGALYMTTGRGGGKRFRLGAWTQSSMLAGSLQPIGTLVAEGDWGFIWQDCDKTLDMCDDRHANAVNYGGFAHFEGAKAATALQA